MPLLVNSVPNLAQGVSQQPDNLRYPGQCDEQINAWATVVEGLVKRPPTNYTKKLLNNKVTTEDPNTGANNLFTHFVKRSEQNKYCVTVSLGNVSLGISAGVGVTLLNGTKVSVAVTSIANSYLSLGGQSSLGAVQNPLADLRALTVADYTFLVNRNKTIQKATNFEQKSKPPGGNPSYVYYNNKTYKCVESHTSTSSFEDDKWEATTDVNTLEPWLASTVYKAQEYETLIVVKLGDYEKAYTIYVDDEMVGLATPLLGQHHDYQSTAHGNTSVQPATYISGPADVEPKGNHADTEFIARDLYDCLNEKVVNTSSGVSTITINPAFAAAEDGWLGGNSSGRTTREVKGASIEEDPEPGRFWDAGWKVAEERKLEVTIAQTGAVTAYAELVVTKGVITGVRNVRKGSNFNPANPVALSYKSYYRRAAQYWDAGYKLNYGGWDEVESPIPPATFNVSNNLSSDPVQVTTKVYTNGGFEIDRQGSVIKLKSKAGPFKVRVEDGLANQALGVVSREVSSITELPVKCYNGFGPVKIIGDADIDQDDYYVIFSTKDNGEFGEGSWVETVGYYNNGSESGDTVGIDTALVSSTMPITLIPFFNNTTITDFKLQAPNELLYVKQGVGYYRLDKDHRASNTNKPGVGVNWEAVWTEVDETIEKTAAVGYLVWKEGTFYYGPTKINSTIGWLGRAAGDDNTNPFPSFVGRTIRDIFFFKNRLGILTDSNVIFSEADEYFNFFRTTTQQLLDSAVIDVGLSHTKVALLENAVPFQEKLMLFSQNSQFVLRGADVLSPKTVAISPVTEYDISDSVQPIALGNYIYFTFKRNNFEGVYEYFVDNNTETFNSEEITQQIPKYITADVQKIAGSQSENTVVISTTADPKTLFVYKYFWSNKEKIQSAWMKFTFGRDVRGFDFIDSNLHLITADSDGLHLESLTLEDGLRDSGLEYTLCLDSRLDGEGFLDSEVIYNPAAKSTTISNIPYDTTGVELYTKLGNERVVSIANSSSINVRGYLASYADDGSGDYVTYNGDMYYCITAHTSGSTFDSSFWSKVTDGPSNPNAWTASTAYSAGVIYKCIKTHTSALGDTLSTSANWSTSTDVKVATRWKANTFYNNDKYFFIGKPYNMLYRFSDQTLKQPTERGGRSASDYAYQTIRNGSIDYADTGHFTVEVTPKYRSKYTYAFNPDSLGANLTLNAFTPQNGHFRFPVQAQPNEAKIEVKSDSALPVKLLGAEFESMFIPRSRRYGA